MARGRRTRVPPLTARRWARRLRNLLILAGLLALGWWLAEPPPPAVGPERVAERFTRCGAAGSGFACVVDGNSFRLGERRIRIRGIDAPEREGQCPAESELAAQAADRLVELLNRGPFVMTAERGDERDRYGRQLRVLTRGRNSIGDAMVEADVAHDYAGAKTGWC